MELKRNGLLYRLYFSDPKHKAFPFCRQITDSSNNKKNFNFYSNVMWITQSSVFQRIHEETSKSPLIGLIMKYTLISVTHCCCPHQCTWSHSKFMLWVHYFSHCLKHHWNWPFETACKTASKRSWISETSCKWHPHTSDFIPWIRINFKGSNQVGKEGGKGRLHFWQPKTATLKQQWASVYCHVESTRSGCTTI